MKKALSILLLIALMLSVAACSKGPEPADAIDVGSPTDSATPGSSTQPGASAAPGTAPGTTGGLESPGAPPAPGTSVSPGASVSPGTSASPAPVTTNMPKSLSEAKKLNSDAVGWIKVPNTNIDYPILYDKGGKFYYLDHDIYKNSSTAGSIVSFYGAPTHNTIITGHNSRQSGTMLHELHKLQNNKSSLTTKANRTFTVTFGDYSKWEVWALYETNDNEPASTLKNNTHPFRTSSGSWSEKEITDWIAKQKSRSEIDLGVSVTADDVILTLYTCGDDYDYSTAQSRLYFFLKAIG